MKVVIDGIAFQLASAGSARLWSSLLPHLARRAGLELVLLNRGDAPSVTGIENVPFPSYKMKTGTAADSFLLDKFCKALGAEVFASTYYTTPVTVPSMLMVYDMIPEVLDLDLNHRPLQEKQIAINFAVKYACIAESTKSDLERFYPGTAKRATVTYCGVDRNIFRPRAAADVARLNAKMGASKPYYLLVGTREGQGNCKNGILAFKAAQNIPNADFELICAGGEPQIAPEWLAQLPPNVSARRLDLDDSELACAYSGAEALVFPSRHAGLAMPVLEAMACGCPVIATEHGSVAELAGDAAIRIAWDDTDGLARAMEKIRQPAIRAAHIERGGKRSAKYDWEATAKGVHNLLIQAREQGSSTEVRDFFREWEKLRRIQAAVDPC